jgi:hypothetical protein
MMERAEQEALEIYKLTAQEMDTYPSQSPYSGTILIS